MSELLHIQEPETPRPPPPDWNAFLELGFRPLYPAACAWAALSVMLWIFTPQWLLGTMTGMLWHAHEMLWGFVMAIAVGFLLTAGATWTGINPLHGRPLAALAALWLVARIGFLIPGQIAFWIACASELLFYLCAAIAMARVVHRSGSQRNYGVAPLLLGMALSDAAYLWGVYRAIDYDLLMARFYTGLLCMALMAILISRRVIPFFASRAVQGLEIAMHLQSGRVQLALGTLAVLALLLQWSHLAALCLLATGLIALWQVIAWKPHRVLGVPLLWILYLGYAGLGAGLVVAALHLAAPALDQYMRMAWPAHVIGMAGFSVLIIGMVTRTALGHLGRPLKTDRSMVAAYALVIAATALRLLALWPSEWTLHWQHASATAWALAFALYLWRFVPMLIRPRPDKPSGTPVSRIPLRPAGKAQSAR